MQKSNLVALSHNALTAFSEICKPVCHELDIPQTAFDILLFLADHPELDTAKEITHHIGIKKNLVSMYVEKLVIQGYLLRESIPGDRRQVRLVVTDKASPVIEKGRRAKKYYQDFLVKGISEEDLIIYRKCLETMADNIEELMKLLKNDKEVM